MAPLRSQINLLPIEFKFPARFLVFQSLAIRASFALMAIYSVLFALLFAAVFLFSTSAQKLEGRALVLTQDIEALREREILLKTLKNRAELARMVFSTKAPLPDELVENVVTLVPGEVKVVGIETHEDRVVLTAISQNLSAVSSFFASLENANFTSVILKTFTATQGNYSFSVEIH